MLGEVQIAYVIIASSCAIISIILQWRKHIREAGQARLSEYERVQQIRARVRSLILDSLVANLLPIRGIYIGLSDEERLRKELEMLFNRPQEVQAISARFCDLLELQSYPRKLARIRLVQTFSLIVGLLALIGALFPLVDVVMDEPLEYNSMSQVALLVFVVSGAGSCITATKKWRLTQRLESIEQPI